MAIQPVAETEVHAIDKVVRSLKELRERIEKANNLLDTMKHFDVDEKTQKVVKGLSVSATTVKGKIRHLENDVKHIAAQKEQEAKMLSKGATWQDYSLDGLNNVSNVIQTLSKDMYKEHSYVKDIVISFYEAVSSSYGTSAISKWRTIFSKNSEELLEDTNTYEGVLKTRVKYDDNRF